MLAVFVFLVITVGWWALDEGRQRHRRFEEYKRYLLQKRGRHRKL